MKIIHGRLTVHMYPIIRIATILQLSWRLIFPAKTNGKFPPAQLQALHLRARMTENALCSIRTRTVISNLIFLILNFSASNISRCDYTDLVFRVHSVVWYVPDRYCVQHNQEFYAVINVLLLDGMCNQIEEMHIWT